MKQAMKCILLLLVLSTHTILTFSQAPQLPKRPLKPYDLSRLEDVGRPFFLCMAISSDAESVAYVLKRSAVSSTSFGFQLSGFNHADIWIANSRDGHQKNITLGATDDSGCWWPRWSPDGQYLAMLSTRGGNIRVWVWNKGSGRLDMLSTHAVSAWDLQ